MPISAWLITLVPLALIVGVALYSARYVRGMADYLVAGRVAGRYLISVGDLQSGLGLMVLVAAVEQQYQCGFALGYWGGLMIPISLALSLTGYCLYRFRETRALSMGQFLELRYSRRFRIFASILRTFSEMLTNAIGPAVAARFFIYYFDLPHAFTVLGVTVGTFPLFTAVVLLLALVMIWPGGRVSLIITDCIQGLLTYPIFLVFTVFVLWKFDFFGEIVPVMNDRVAGESFLNPFDIAEMRDFNLFGFMVIVVGGILNRASWIGNDTSGNARTPHEQKMAGILGAWRNGFSQVMILLVGVAIITLMNHARHAPDARDIRAGLVAKVAEETIPDDGQRARALAMAADVPGAPHVIGADPALSRKHNLDTPYLDAVHGALQDEDGGNATFQRFRTLYYQMMTPTVLRHMLPTALLGLFCLMAACLMITTDDSRIFNASATIVQDVVMPLRKTPFTKRQHFRWLRGCTLGVCVFFFLMSVLFQQMDYINMFIYILVSIWLGGAGPVMVFGLYSRFGTTAGAWASLFCGSGVSLSGVVLQYKWADVFYPFLERRGWVEAVDGFLRAVSAPFAPYVQWEMDAVKFPINSWEIYFVAMVAGLAAYIGVSWLTRGEPFNLDRMLHRGKYVLDGEHAVPAARSWSWRRAYVSLLGITPECTRGDRIIIGSVLVYSVGYQFLLCFVGMGIWNWVSPLTPEHWAWYFFINNIVVAALVGLVSTVWFTWGGWKDLRQLFRDLRARPDNPLDDGWVEGNVSLADKERVRRIEAEDANQRQQETEKSAIPGKGD